MNRIPIRARMTATFALAMLVVLVGVALVVFLRLRADLDESIAGGLTTRAAAIAAAAPVGGVPPAGAGGGQVEEAFAQVLAADGRVLDASGGVRRRVLTAGEVRRAARVEVRAERKVPGIEARARVLARPLPLEGGDAAGGSAPPRVVLVGQSLDDRNVALSGLVTSFAIGGGLALMVASLLGYALATSGLRPMEAMRRRAAAVSLTGGDAELPLPAAHDEVRRLGETLNAMLERLRATFDRERRFVADASHELRTPIAVIKTELEGALRSEDQADVRAALVASIEECDRLAQLAEDLLVLARSADGALPVRRESVEVAPLLGGVRERFRGRADERGRAIRVEVDDGLRVDADPLRLGQALGNLVDNALRHGGGEIILTARAAHGGVEVDTADAGPGFQNGFAHGAFDRFTRGDVARTDGGAGLGLAIVRAVAEAHGGTATILPGAGATVRVYVPRRATDAGRADPARGAVPTD